jgi:dTDP-4-dehydrorhamnose 3,5-epimerase
MFKDGEISGVIIRESKPFYDRRGWLAELFRTDDLPEGFDPCMGYLSVTHPGITRGPHEHREQTDFFCFFGKFNLYLWDNRKHSSTYLHRQIVNIAERLIVLVPPGVVHAYQNTGEHDGMVLNFPDRLYAGKGRKEEVDEMRYEDDPESPYKVG